MRGRLLLVLALALSLLGSATGASVAGLTGPPGGQILGQLPWSAPGPEAVVYRSVSCAAPDHCVALGDSSPDNGPTVPVAVTLTPSGASTTRLPVPPLPTSPTGVIAFLPQAISCPTTESCVALSAGGTESHADHPVVDVLSAGSWSALTLPLPARARYADVHSISCPVTGVCVATGSVTGADGVTSALVETLRDGRWTAEVLPSSLTGGSLADGARLDVVSCPVDGSCTVLGRRASGLVALRLSAGVWTPSTVSTPAGASEQTPVAISCPQVDDCTAVGRYSTSQGLQAFAVRLRPTASKLTLLSGPGGAYATPAGVDCADSSHCVAVGQLPDHRIAWSFAGAGWTRQELPPSSSAATGDELNAIDCTSATSCVAVGSSRVPAGTSYDGLIETLAAGAWTARTERADGVPSAGAVGVGCSSDLHCTAIGGWKDPDDKSGLLTETQVDNTWAAADVAVPAGSALKASGIACPAPGACVATGIDEATGGVFVATQTGPRSWAISTPALPGRVQQAYSVSAPSCPAVGHCVAVTGYVDRASGQTRQVGLTLSGGAWTAATLPRPADANGDGAYPAAVSCPTTTWCTYVGAYTSLSGRRNYSGTLSNGVWSAAAIPEQGKVGAYTSVSCPVVGGCVAVGYGAPRLYNRYNPKQAVLSGGTWVSTALAIPASVQNQTLMSVSCASTTSCVAVGFQTLPGGASNALIARLVAATWKRTIAPNPVGGQLGRLLSVSCGATTCTAVGDARTADGGLKPVFALASLG